MILAQIETLTLDFTTMNCTPRHWCSYPASAWFAAPDWAGNRGGIGTGGNDSDPSSRRNFHGGRRDWLEWVDWVFYSYPWSRWTAQRACGGYTMISNLTECEKAQEEIHILEEWLERLQQTHPIGSKGFTKAGIRKMIARLHEELAVYEGSEEARQPVSSWTSVSRCRRQGSCSRQLIAAVEERR